MSQQEGYLIVDIGTGNVRVAITGRDGKVLHIERDNVCYIKDELYPDALYFDPEKLWEQIMNLAQRARQNLPQVSIQAITASSQREGIVLIDGEGRSLIGLSNHDHRGREWEDMLEDKHHVYALAGRYPTSLFSAFKIIGIRNRRPEIYKKLSKILSISDWAQFMLSGIEGYEHSQASETLLYDVAQKSWSPELCAIFDIPEKLLPELRSSGAILGRILPSLAEQLSISPETPIIVGGADTQLAIKSTQPSVNDTVIVSGTTTPIAKIISNYIIDTDERTWTNRHIDTDSFILEANAGVTGLNYQRLKAIFYPNEGYDTIERELAEHPQSLCVASLGSLVADEKSPITRGGFIINTPVSHELSRAGFVHAILWDIACCIKENFQCLCKVSAHEPEFVWACGGGFQSHTLRQLIANLIGKKVRLRQGFEQSSVVGGALICNEALGIKASHEADFEEISPQRHFDASLYEEWKATRQHFQQTVLEEPV